MGLPYFPLYVTDYEADTAHLTLEEDGVYMRLLRLCWRTVGCSIPADPKWIARHMRVTWEDFERVVAPILVEFFKLKSGRYYSPRLMKEAEKVSVANSKRKIAGSKGGVARALKYKENVSSNAIAMLKHPEPEPEPYKERDTNVSLKKEATSSKPRKRASSSLPDGWVPDVSRFHSIKEELDLTSKEMNYCFQRMKEHAHATDRRQVDWNAALANWIRKAANDGEIGPNARSRKGSESGSMFAKWGL